MSKLAQNSVETINTDTHILTINGKKAVATKDLISGFGITKHTFAKMWERNESEFIQGKDWDWFSPAISQNASPDKVDCLTESQNSTSGQIVNRRNNSPKISRIFWTTGVSKASTKFNSEKAKEFAQKMFDNYGSQLNGETRLAKLEEVPNAHRKLPANYEEALEELLHRVKRERQLELENEHMKPKADYFDIVVNQNPHNLSVMETTSQFLNQENKITISYVRVWKIMRENKWITYQGRTINSKKKHPFPSQKPKEEGWLTTTEARTEFFDEKTGEKKEILNTQILITPAGRLELLKLVKKYVADHDREPEIDYLLA